MILDKINHPGDVKKLNSDELEELAKEIRQKILYTVSQNGGHLASSLGVVELTIALLIALDIENNDKIVWDVGHQSYAYKILTGRKDSFSTLRQFGGISGFPRMYESPYDFFGVGHSSTSISVGLGFCAARELKQNIGNVVSVIGDGSLTGGEAFEALNNASKIKSNFIIILNDNDMSISKNNGGLHLALEGVRTSYKYLRLKEITKQILEKIPLIGNHIINFILQIKNIFKQIHLNKGMLFENMDIAYIGTIDGHDIQKLVKTINKAKKIKKAVVIHIKTKKGKGYEIAEKNPVKYHGISPFNIITGDANSHNKQSYTKIFSNKIVEMAAKDESICALTAAMPTGTGLDEFEKNFPNRFFDTGISEQHATTFAASLAASGLKPILCLYSTFAQRSYDQILHDIALQELPVVLCIDRAGIVGEDGETHQGIFDLSYLCSIPNMVVMAPKNGYELEQMLDFAIKLNKPVAIRYPRGEAYLGFENCNEKIQLGKAEYLYSGKDICLFALGSLVKDAENIAEKLREQSIYPTLVNARFAKPIDFEIIEEISATHKILVTLEENVSRGAMGESISSYLHSINTNIKFINISLPDKFVPHGDVTSLKKMLEIDVDSVVKKILNSINF